MSHDDTMGILRNHNKRPYANGAIVGGGKGCESILKMAEGGSLGSFRMRISGVADKDPEARGCLYAKKIGVPMVTTDYRDLYEIPNLDLIIELTGRDTVREEIEQTRPRHIHLIDHFGARLFWDLHQSQKAILEQRTEMQSQVELEREHISQILDSIPDEIVVIDKDMLIKDANSSFLKNNNLQIGDVRGCHCYDVDQAIRGECQIAVGNCPYNTVMKERKPTNLIRKHINSSGQMVYSAIVGAPWFNSEGEVVGMIEMTRDITKRIRLEEELTATEVRLDQFMKFSPLAIYVKNSTGQYIDVNPAACTMFGRTESELIGKTDLEILPREEARRERKREREAWRELKAVSYNVKLPMGDRELYLSTVKFPIIDASGKPNALCGLSEDITAQKEAENKLNETREYLQQILDNSPVIIVTTDLEGRIVSFNAGAEKLLGYSAREVIGQQASLFYEDPERRTELLKQVMGGKALQDYEAELVKKNGERLPVSISLSQLMDSRGNVIGTVGMSKDISHRKSLMQQALQSERMAAVGRLASGVAHEINNPLAIISEIAGFLNELISDEQPVEEVELRNELKDGLEKISKHVRRGREITRRLLKFARKSEARVYVTDINNSLDEILPFLEKEASLAQASIHRDYHTALPKVAIEEMQFQEIFINLITNAIHAISGRKKGNIWLSTRLEKGKVVITVKDDGPGIDENIRNRIFDPFVTTKAPGQGTGLGLSICYGIVKRYDGEIRMLSKPEKGTTFKVYLPPHNDSSHSDSVKLEGESAKKFL